MVAFSGTVLIGLATSSRGIGASWGVVLCLVAALAYSAAVIAQKPVLARVSGLQVTWLACTVGALMCLPFAPTLAHEGAHASASAIGWTIYLGAAPTAIGFVAWAYALARTSAGRLGSTTYLASPIAILLGWALLGETPPWLAILGGTLCLGGVVIARRT